MILKLYDLNHTLIGGLKNHKDAKVESELSTGDKTLSFSWHRRNERQIPHEYYLRTDKDEFVVKENSKGSNGYRNIVAKLNLEDIEGRVWDDYVVKECTAQYAADYALTGTGWTCVSTVPGDRLRSISLKRVNAYQVMEKILEAFTCEVEYDTFSKVVYLKERVGKDKGVYFASGVNLKEVSDSGDTYDYATRIIPIGADGLEITGVNNGKRYLENYQYSNKVKTIIWEDTNYTDPEALKADAEYKLNEISKPKKTFQAKIADLARMKPEYEILSYSVGDTVTIMDSEAGIHEKQRITNTVEYLNNPEKNTCDISNTVLSFEEMQKKLFAAAECIGNITTDNGTVKGSSVDSIDVTQIIGLERYIAEDINDLKVNFLYVRSEFGTPYAVIGNGILTQADVTNLNITGREDSALSYITELHTTNAYGDYAKFTVVEADNIAALEARIDKIASTEVNTAYLEANYAQIDMANVNTASIRQGFLDNLMVDQGIIADRIVSGEVVATKTLTGINLYADDITAGTLSVDRLILRGDDKSLVYALNNSGGLVSTQVDTLDAYLLTDRTITADKIVAGSITSTEINVSDLVSTGFIGANRITAKNIFVDDLKAMGATIGGFTIGDTYIANNTLTLAGVSDSVYLGLDGMSCGNRFKVTRMGDLMASNADITGKITASSGEIGGFTIGATALYNGTVSKTSTVTGVYIGTDAIRQYGSASAYTHIEGGKLTCFGAEIKGTINATVLNVDKKITMYDSAHSKMVDVLYIDEPGEDVQAIHINGGASVPVTIDTGATILNGASVVGNISATGAVYASNWLRTYGATGWYSQTYGGGWYMTDSTYIRNYNSKHLLLSANCYFGSTSYYINSSGGARLQLVRLGSTGYGLNSDGSAYLGGLTLASNYLKNDSGDMGLANDTVKIGLWSSAFRPHGDYAGAATLGSGSCRWGQIYTTKAVSVSSDIGIKNSIEYLDGTGRYQQFFHRLKPSRYRLNDEMNGKYHLGFIAQEVEEALLEAELTKADFAGLSTEEGFYSLCYEEFIPLITAVQQSTILRVDAQEEMIRALQNQLYNMRFELEQAKLRISQLEAVA